MDCKTVYALGTQLDQSFMFNLKVQITTYNVTVRVILTLQHCGGHVTGVVGVDLKSLAPASSVRARRDRESPQALRYGGGSVTRIVAPMVVVGPGP